MTFFFEGGDLLIAVDAQAVAYRGFYAFSSKPLRNRRGLNTSAIYYFDTLLRKLLKEYSPTYGVVGFDTKAPTFRHEIDREYKARRPETPDELVEQMEYIKRISEALGVRAFSKAGYEADDILASAAVLAKNNRISAILVTADKDIMALVDDRVKVLNVVDERIYDRDAVLKKFGVFPEQLPDYLALVGDPTDNVEGIRGIGKKTAQELLVRYGSLKGILENLEEISERNEKVARAIREAYESGRLQKTLEIVKLAVEPFFTLEEIRIKEPKRDELVRLYRYLDFYSALKEIATAPKLPKPKPYEGQEVKGLGYDGKKFYLSDGEDVYVSDEIPKKVLYTVNLKELYRRGFQPELKVYDLSLCDYLLQPEMEESKPSRHDLPMLALKYMAWRVDKPTEIMRAQLSAKIGESLMEELKREGLYGIYADLELPLVEVLADMERVGVKVDLDYMRELDRELEERIREYEKKIYEIAGHAFNLNSPRQLAKVLFEEMGLEPVKKTKTGYSTDVEVLTALASKHPLPAMVLRYRELFKIRSTYVQGLLKYVSDDGRIHPNFSQTTTATGRLSCYDPNLQNVPARGEWGKKVRRAFIPSEGYLLVDYDYSQIELRVLAHLSKDDNLLKIFMEDGDIHTETARTLFGKGSVTEEERRVAKTVNFGIIYGISPYGLSKTLGVDFEKAKEMIERYYERFPKVREWQEETLKFAKEKGYVQTILGRRRYIYSDPTESDVWRRIAINTPVQGSAADIIKVAMLKVHSILKGRESRLLLQVHDELLFEIKEEELDLLEAIKREMENAVKLDVKIKVDFGVGKSWAEAH